MTAAQMRRADVGSASATLSELVREAARRWGSKPAIRCDRRQQTATFAELDRLVDLVAEALRSRGIGRGRHVGVMFRNDLEFPVAWLGIVRAGAAMVPLNVHLTDRDLEQVLDDIRPSFVLAASEFGQRFAPLINTGGGRLFLVPDGAGSVADLEQRLAPMAADGSVGHNLPVGQGARPESLANVQFTSGSTGLAKGCLLSNRYWLTIADTVSRYGPRLCHDDILLSAQPFYYMDPQWNLVAALTTGATLVILERFRSQTFWRSVQEHGATFFYCLGVMPAMLLRTPRVPGEQISQVRYVACSAIPGGRHAELEERFGAPWYELYGSTETGLDIMVEEDEHDAAVRSGTIGRPMPNREIMVVDDDGMPVPRGEIGRLLVRGVGLSDGYLHERGASQSTTGNGWYVTGDLAVWEDDGSVFFRGRVKDIIRRSGENISAAQVEDLLLSHESVQLCACLPVLDDLRGEEVKAYVVPSGDLPADFEMLVAYAREHLAYFKVPRYWEFRAALPLTPSEKIAKGTLRRESHDALGPCFDAVTGEWLEQVRPLPEQKPLAPR
ncbi:MAG: class I adenylate-forming enzyme family protein [Nocardioidaceae bacterium]